VSIFDMIFDLYSVITNHRVQTSNN